MFSFRYHYWKQRPHLTDLKHCQQHCHSRVRHCLKQYEAAALRNLTFFAPAEVAKAFLVAFLKSFFAYLHAEFRIIVGHFGLPTCFPNVVNIMRNHSIHSIHTYIYFLLRQVGLRQPKGWWGPAGNLIKNYL